MTDSVVVEGYARLRDGKKWKTRWLVLRKPSPVADCLVLLVFKDKSEKVQGGKERARVVLEEICGLEAGQWYEGVAFTLAVLCLGQAALLGFDSREALQAWEARLRYSLGEVHRFSVAVLPGTKLESGPATLHLCNNLLALTRDVPPVVIGHWSLPDLRRYGPVPNGFVFEGGTRCGYWAGVFLLSSAESEQISFLFDCIVRGISPTRGPFGLRPVLPELASSQNSEERLEHEAQELEKRLSMLSHGSSTVSSAGGDDRSISGSSDTSDTSQSDCSIGSRSAVWPEPASHPPGTGSLAGHAAHKVALQIVEKLPTGQASGGRAAAGGQRQLQEIGRQSSSDSGIATGSHSSFSGSFSSYAGSFDVAPGEDFGSAFALPPGLAPDLSPCSCPTGLGREYQVPTSLRYLYDTPRSLLQEVGEGAKDCEASASTKDSLVPSGLGAEATSEGHPEAPERQPVSGLSPGLSEGGKTTKVVPSSDSIHSCSSPTCAEHLPQPSKNIVSICSVCGGFKGGTLYVHSTSSVAPAIPVKKSPEKSHSGNTHGTEPPTAAISEEWPPSKKRGQKLVSLLSDLLSVPSADRQPEARAHRLNLYESMSPVLENELNLAPAAPLRGSQQDKRDAIYENCLKCRGARCHPPPRATPAKIHRSGDVFAFHTVPTGPRLTKSQEPDGSADEEPLHQALREEGGPPLYGKINDQTVNEDKKFKKDGKHRANPAYEIMEGRVPERSPEAEEKNKYELMGSCSQQRFLQEAEGAVFVFPQEASLPERHRSEGVTYVNIPISPTSKKQLNYMELELQESGHVRGTMAHLPAQRKSSTKYAQIDIAATETAHKVGAQHALGRQEGLHTLESRRKGTPR
ncbi:protein Dok-7-like isoform 1-T1 [Menidia menidia]